MPRPVHTWIAPATGFHTGVGHSRGGGTKSVALYAIDSWVQFEGSVGRWLDAQPGHLRGRDHEMGNARSRR